MHQVSPLVAHLVLAVVGVILLAAAAGCIYMGPVSSLLEFKKRRIFMVSGGGLFGHWISRDERPVSYWLFLFLYWTALPAVAFYLLVMDLHVVFHVNTPFVTTVLNTFSEIGKWLPHRRRY